MGRSETAIVAIKVAILVLFAAVGLWFVKPGNLSPALWPETKSILFGAGVLFIGYEGFGLVTNAAGDMRNPSKLLPRALYTSVILVIIIYLAVSVTVSGNLSDAEIERAKDYALAQAARPFLGEFGFRLIAIAALFSTASAINATLFGSANVCYMIARDGELPRDLSRTEWRRATNGLLLTAALVVLVMLAFDLSGIAMMGSAAFLLIYAAVNAGHLRVLGQTGANAVIVWLSLITCLVMFVILSIYTWQQQPAAIVALVAIAAASFVAEWRLPALDRAQRSRTSAWSAGSEAIVPAIKKPRRCGAKLGRNRSETREHANPLHCAAGSFPVPYTRSGFSWAW